jgi:serine/threonine protein kinase
LDHEWLITYNDLYFITKLGRGVSSTVYKGTWKEKVVAIKVLRLELPKDLKDFKKELYIMSKIKAPNIVHFFGATLEPKLCIVMELCVNGSLYNYLSKSKHELTWDNVLKWINETARGINTLHSWKPPIVHRDLKTFNLLLDENLNIKVCDFGLSRYMDQGDEISVDTTLQKLRGTYAYTAPEMYCLKNDVPKSYTPKSDVYSLGIIVWEIVTCIITGELQRPYGEFPDIKYDYQIIFNVAQKSLRPTIPPMCHKKMKQLIEHCWAQEPVNRPTAFEVIDSVKQLRKNYTKKKSKWYISPQIKNSGESKANSSPRK